MRMGLRMCGGVPYCYTIVPFGRWFSGMRSDVAAREAARAAAATPAGIRCVRPECGKMRPLSRPLLRLLAVLSFRLRCIVLPLMVFVSPHACCWSLLPARVPFAYIVCGHFFSPCFGVLLGAFVSSFEHMGLRVYSCCSRALSFLPELCRWYLLKLYACVCVNK